MPRAQVKKSRKKNPKIVERAWALRQAARRFYLAEACLPHYTPGTTVIGQREFQIRMNDLYREAIAYAKEIQAAKDWKP